MKDFIVDFLKLFANCILIICLALASFLLILNVFHSKELSYSYNIDVKSDVSYSNYKKSLNRIAKKMNSVNYNSVQYSTTAKPIYEYYARCIKTLNDGYFDKFDTKTSVNGYDIYIANKEVKNTYANECSFSIANNISHMSESKMFNNKFDDVMKNAMEKRNIVIDNSDYLVNSSLANSSYYFYTDMFRAGVFNQIYSDYNLTVNNYELIASTLDEIADWYVLEFGGNNNE